MTFLKRKIRKFLTDRQHRNYEKTISEKKLSYEEWIEKQEEKIAVRCKILEETAKCLTIMQDLIHPKAGTVENSWYGTKTVEREGWVFLCYNAVISESVSGRDLPGAFMK